MNTLPRLHRSADRCYTLVEPFNVGAFRAYLESIGGRYIRPSDGALYLHRWILDTPAGRTVITYFPSGRIVALGPAVAALDELVECGVPV
jgi:hypothetical protein